MSEPDDLPVLEGYDAWAPLYDDDGNPLIAVEGPALREWFGPLEGRRVLDLGCGTGRHTLALVAAGASVSALDGSSEMLARARFKLRGYPVELGPASAPRPPALRRIDVRPGRPRPVAEHIEDLSAES